MLNLTPEQILSLPLDRLALAVLVDMHGEWNERNYLLRLEQSEGVPRHALRLVMEAQEWLHARGLIASNIYDNSAAAFFITRAGERVLVDGTDSLYATERLQEGLHSVIERKARPQFLLGEFEQAVFASMKAVEVRVRKLGGFANDDIGVSLMNKAFGPSGPLTDPEASAGEQDGTRALFVGAYAVLRNPSGHREVDYDDVAEAAEAVQTASLLMRILDRVEKRRRIRARKKS